MTGVQTCALPILGINFNDDIVYVSDICGMYSQLDILKDFPFSKEERENIKIIKNIVNYGMIDENVLFNYGLYISQVAGGILKVDKEYIIELDKNLPIRRNKDINITTYEICEILNIKPNRTIHLVYNELKELILHRNLENENVSIREYLKNNRKKWFLNEGEVI